MTRPAAAARKNHQGSRHENGQVSSSRKVSKQKSNGHLNGTLNGHKPPPVPDLPPLNASGSERPSTTPSPGSIKSDDAVEGTNMVLNGQILARGDGSSGGVAPNGHVHQPSSANGVASGIRGGDCVNRRPEKLMGPMPGVKKAYASKSVNPFHLASTILKACPMADTIAILIFLLQLPPIMLTLVQFLYASMTFMLPAGVSSGTLTSNFDIFQGPAGTPSLSTMIAMDAFCLLVWSLFMWNWARNFAIDLAHIQVAIALGAGSSGDTSGVNAFCVSVLLAVHLLRSEGIQDFVFGHLLSANIVSSDILEKYSILIPTELKRIQSPSSPGWVRSLLAVHILAQAGTAMARRSMAKNRSPPRTKTGKRHDTEASAGAQFDSSTLEPGASPSPLTNSEALPLPGSVTNEGRDRVSSAKKRRRQANEARRLQPFWAALASTKLTVTREYDRSRHGNWYSPDFPVAEDDLERTPPGNGLIWITHIDSSSIKFAASDLATDEDPMLSGAYDCGASDTDPDPFYVCVNGAHWAPVSLTRIPENSDEPSLVHWRGEIAGLAPDCAYACSFVRYDNDEEIGFVSMKTPPASDTDQGKNFVFTLIPGKTNMYAASIAPPIPSSPSQSLRPSSPTTTLKNSIVNAEAKLNERRAKLKRARNDHKIQLSKIKKELDNFTHRLNSGGDDSRQKQRSLQLERNIRQTEEATAAFELQLETLGSIPEEEMQEWDSHKAIYQQETDQLKSLKSELDDVKSATDREASSAENELTTIVQKRERLQNRCNRLSEQYERITNANNQGLNERERRAAEQIAKEQEHARIEENFQEQLTSLTASLEEYQLRTTRLWQQAMAIEQVYQQQQLYINSGPLTPEGDLPGTKTQPVDTTSFNGPVCPSVPNITTAFPMYNANEKPSLAHRSSMSPVMGTSLHAGYTEPQLCPSSPFASKRSMFTPEQSSHRGRSMSSFSSRSTQVEYSTPPLFGDIAEAEVRRNPTFIPNPLNHSLAQFKRTDSRSSGSGSGSGSGDGSPHSSRLKSAWPS
ncbi:hypothetical protein LOZ55_003045 [Ophidiomyces ophidiicola]|nr:hypothetical protein LOZ55_003045 [Ophidiomyces ophidiicola]